MFRQADRLREKWQQTKEPSGRAVIASVKVAGAFATLGSLLLGVSVLHSYRPFSYFDDAYMFLRYAAHFRQGHGIAWNLHEPPIYGLTSMTWFVVIALTGMLPLTMADVLTLASWGSGMLALTVMAVSISAEAQTSVLRSTVCVFPLLFCNFLLNSAFDMNMVNGMETMFSLLLNALYCWAACRFLRAPSMPRATCLALLGVLATLTRPEAALCVTAIPAMGWVLLLRRRHSGVFAAYFSMYAGLVALDLLACHFYFHSALPLSFYMKSRHAYLGYTMFWDWPQYLLLFLQVAAPALLIMLMIGRARQLPWILTFSVPVALTFVYLATVTQIMGAWGRYYMPYAAFLVLPAFVVLDEYYADGRPLVRVRAFQIMALVGVLLYSAEYPRLSRHIRASLRAYPRPVFHVPASHPLPFMANAQQCFHDFSEIIAEPLPPGTEVAASEVGILGATARQVDVLDLVGLNDTTIAHQGFTPAYVLQRAPDVLWFPYTDYTYLYGTLASDPELTRRYTVLAGAFNYGLAVRRDSPVYQAAMARLRRSWSSLYPGTRLEDYIVDHVTWKRGPLVAAEPNLPPVVGPLKYDAVPATHQQNVPSLVTTGHR